MSPRPLTNPFHLSPDPTSHEQLPSHSIASGNIPASPTSSVIYTNYGSSTSSETIPRTPSMSFCECSKRDHEITLRYREMELDKAEIKFKAEKAELELKQYKQEFDLRLQKEKIDIEIGRKKVQLEAKHKAAAHTHAHRVPQHGLYESKKWRDTGKVVGVVILVVVAFAALVLLFAAFVMVMTIPIRMLGCWILGCN